MSGTGQCMKLYFLFETLKGDATTPTTKGPLLPNPNSSAVIEIIFMVGVSHYLTSSVTWHIQARAITGMCSTIFLGMTDD